MRLIQLSMLVLCTLVACDSNGNEADPQPVRDMTPDSISDATKDMRVTDCVDASLKQPDDIQTTVGLFRGRQSELGSKMYLGIPYAQPPKGQLRWKPPAALDCVKPRQVFEAKEFSSPCPQKDFLGRYLGDEDCLTLNIWTPSKKLTNLPVLVFIHGGANISGSASDTIDFSQTLTYDGQYIAQRADAIVVTIQYRLGPLGFLALPELTAESGTSGMFGIQDQLMALQWIQKHIQAFGGDPSQVLLFGESAGAHNTLLLAASPLATGLFRAIAVQSGGAAVVSLAKMETTHSTAVKAKITPCANAQNRLECLRMLDAKTLVEALPGSFNSNDKESTPYHGVVDNVILKDIPLTVFQKGQHPRVPMIVGSNADEMDIPFILPNITTQQEYEEFIQTLPQLKDEFVVEDVVAAYPLDDFESGQKAAAQILTDITFTCISRDIALAAASGLPQVPVYQYLFSRRPIDGNGDLLLATHAFELRYVFGSLRNGPKGLGEMDFLLSDTIIGAWVMMAKTGKPTSPQTSLVWPTFSSTEQQYVSFDHPTAIKNELAAERCKIWHN